MPTPSKYSKRFIEATIVACKGNLSAAARQLDVQYNTLWKYVNSKPELRQAQKIAGNAFVDIAAEKLLEGVKEGDTRSIELAIRYWGKFAGLGERHELTGADGEALLSQHMDKGLLKELLARGETAETILAGLIQSANEELHDVDSMEE